MSLKNDFMIEMDFIANIGRKMFLIPFIGRTKNAIHCYFFIYLLLFLTSMQLFIKLCLLPFTNWFEIINIAPNFGVCLIILVKYGKVHKNKELYENISRHFRCDLWEVVFDCVEHKEILSRYTKVTRLIIRFQFYYTIILAIILDCFPRFIMFYETNVVGKEKQYLYPFDGWYPLDKVQWYNIVYIWESFMSTIVIFLYVFVNMLHIFFTRCICMELKFLDYIMENVINKNDVFNIRKQINLETTHYHIRQKLKFIIEKHQYLAKLASELDVVLGDGMLLTYLFGSVFICLTAFTATVVDDSYKSIRYFSFFCSLLVDTFFQCIMGQLLINHSQTFEKAICSAKWIFADSYTKNLLLMFLMLVQKPFRFSANGYLFMNLDTFSNICSLSYQLFNLLRTAYFE